MKPSNWDEMSTDEQRIVATKLFASPRGSYIMGQALGVAVQEMKKVDGIHREVSNIEDMEMLQILFFPHMGV